MLACANSLLAQPVHAGGLRALVAAISIARHPPAKNSIDFGIALLLNRTITCQTEQLCYNNLMPAKISPSLALDLISGPTFQPIARPLSRQVRQRVALPAPSQAPTGGKAK
jgi:hypothetical protein